MDNPKEKAKDLYDKMKGFRVKNSHRKKCALICVDEILSIAPYKTYKETISPYDGAELSTDYWHEVKNEIEKL